MKKINFIKMQSLGNDFVIIDKLKNTYKLNKKIIKNISDNLGWVATKFSFTSEKKSHLIIKYIIKMDQNLSMRKWCKMCCKILFDKYEKIKRNYSRNN